jgi:DNA-binding response OmpR family regulator
MAKILIAEEEAVGRDALAVNLRAEGFEVVTAHTSDEGLRLAYEQTPDLLILDLRLPHLDGLSLCRLLRRCSEVPILMLTTRPPELHQLTSLEVSQDDYMLKPIMAGELITRVRTLLRPAAVGHSGLASALQSGDLVLDLIARRARLGTTTLKLTQKEFALLAELMRYRGRVLSRDLLLAHVWGRDYAESRHTVDVHIR